MSHAGRRTDAATCSVLRSLPAKCADPERKRHATNFYRTFTHLETCEFGIWNN